MIDLTLNSFLHPNIIGLQPQFGTVITPDAQNKGGLSTTQVDNNMGLPFALMRPILVGQTDTTSQVEYDAKLMITGEQSVTITLGDAVYEGCKVTVFNKSAHPCFITSSKIQSVSQGQIVIPSDNLLELSYTESRGWMYTSNMEFTDVSAKDTRWLRYDFNATNKKTLKILKGTNIRVNNSFVFFDKDISYDLSSQITENGKDYYVFLDSARNITISTIKTDSIDRKRIGQFHTLCVDAGTMTAIAPTEKIAIGEKYLIKEYSDETDSDFYNFYNKNIDDIKTYTYYNVATVEHPLSGFQAGDILPESVWCLTFHPSCENWNGMVYDKDTNIAVDIYLQSGKGKSTASVYGATHTVSRQHGNHQEDLRAVGKRMLKDFEFTSIASGSNEKTNIQGSNDKGTVGGNVDTANRRMISFIGCEECCGYLKQWLDEICDSSSTEEWFNADGHGIFGHQYWSNRVLLAGGDWGNGVSCGSRSRIANQGIVHVDGHLGSRGSAGVTRGV